MSWISLDHVTLHYDLRARGGSPVILLHELGGSLDSFDDVMPFLRPGHTVLRYDQRGAGLSEKPRLAFTIADHADDLAALLAALGIDDAVHLIGVAAGCAIAVAYALDSPDRVRSLSLCSPALSVAPDRRSYLSGRSELAITQGMAAIVEATLALSYPLRLRQDTARFEAYRGRFLGNDPVGYAHANLALADSDLVPRLGELTAPCLLLAGAHDLLRPPDTVAALRDAIRHAEFAIVDSGHLMPVQAPDAMGRAVARFIASTEAQARRALAGNTETVR